MTLTALLRRKGLAALAALAVAAPACTFDVTDPNNPSEADVVSTAEGIRALAVGLQQYYANTALEAIIMYPGVTSRELTINITYLGMEMLEDGGDALSGSAGQVSAYWSRMVRVMSMSEKLLTYAPDVTLDPGTRSGIIAMAHLYKALAIAHLSQAFEQVVLDTDPDENATFHTRAEAMAAVLDHLEQAEQTLQATAQSDEFRTRIVGAAFDLDEAVTFFRARYSLIAGDYAAAIAAADAVDPASVSYFNYDALNPNPVYVLVNEIRYYAPRDDMGTPVTEAGDGRLDFYLVPLDTVSNPKLYPIDGLAGFFTTQTTPIPVYIPGELALIRAEAHLRNGDLASAVAEIDAVRTKTPAQDPLGIGAGLPPYSGPVTVAALEEEIYRQRAAELFLTGMRFEDSRRLARPGPPADLTERNRNWYPYPTQERLNNPNTPPDPSS